jgi:hypothetical protein
LVVRGINNNNNIHQHMHTYTHTLTHHQSIWKPVMTQFWMNTNGFTIRRHLG